MRRLSSLFWIETILAFASAVFLTLTLVWEDWIEIVFGVDPDNHGGSLEWMIALGCAAVFVVFTLLARQEWRRAVRVR